LPHTVMLGMAYLYRFVNSTASVFFAAICRLRFEIAVAY